jgi:hypothetical protein
VASSISVLGWVLSPSLHTYATAGLELREVTRAGLRAEEACPSDPMRAIPVSLSEPQPWNLKLATPHQPQGLYFAWNWLAVRRKLRPRGLSDLTRQCLGTDSRSQGHGSRPKTWHLSQSHLPVHEQDL